MSGRTVLDFPSQESYDEGAIQRSVPGKKTRVIGGLGIFIGIALGVLGCIFGGIAFHYTTTQGIPWVSNVPISYAALIVGDPTSDGSYMTPLPAKMRLVKQGVVVTAMFAYNGSTNLINGDAGGAFHYAPGTIPTAFLPQSELNLDTGAAVGTALIFLNGRSGNSALFYIFVSPNGGIDIFPFAATADSPPILEIGLALPVAFVGQPCGMTIGQAQWTTAA